MEAQGCEGQGANRTRIAGEDVQQTAGKKTHVRGAGMRLCTGRKYTLSHRSSLNLLRQTTPSTPGGQHAVLAAQQAAALPRRCTAG